MALSKYARLLAPLRTDLVGPQPLCALESWRERRGPSHSRAARWRTRSELERVLVVARLPDLRLGPAMSYRLTEPAGCGRAAMLRTAGAALARWPLAVVDLMLGYLAWCTAPGCAANPGRERLALECRVMAWEHKRLDGTVEVRNECWAHYEGERELKCAAHLGRCECGSDEPSERACSACTVSVCRHCENAAPLKHVPRDKHAVLCQRCFTEHARFDRQISATAAAVAAAAAAGPAVVPHVMRAAEALPRVQRASLAPPRALREAERAQRPHKKPRPALAAADAEPADMADASADMERELDDAAAELVMLGPRLVLMDDDEAVDLGQLRRGPAAAVVDLTDQ